MLRTSLCDLLGIEPPIAAHTRALSVPPVRPLVL
jgi:hypothetical protein